MTRTKTKAPEIVFTPNYSGMESHPFWEAVNALPEPDQTFMYSFALALQDIEHHALLFLRDAQSRAHARAATSAKRKATLP